MAKTTLTVWCVVTALSAGGAWRAHAQRQAQPGSAEAPDETLLQWPLPPGDSAYGAIDGKHLHRYVVEQAAISRRYRDQGHPKFWGRIIGTSADAESADWLAATFKAIGVTDVRIQPVDLEPQWMPQSWQVSIASGGKTIQLDSAQPDYNAAATPPGGLDLEASYVGLGSEADFAGKDVRGKAVFVFNMVGLKPEGASRRADAKGAAAIFEVGTCCRGTCATRRIRRARKRRRLRSGVTMGTRSAS